MMRELGLFAGIGAFSLGLERSGLARPVAFVEIDPFCQKVLRKHWPDVPCHDNVLTREFVDGEAEIITAGFPCQDISLAGTGTGLAGERSGLYREVVRAIRVVRPQYAILENVAALLSRGLGTVLGDLAEIGNDAEWHCIPASAVGAPHRRDRIWIIANAGSEQHEGHRTPLSGKIASQLHGSFADAECDELWEQSGRCSGPSGEGAAFPAHDGKQGLVANPESIGCGQGRQRRTPALREDRNAAFANPNAKALLGTEEFWSEQNRDCTCLAELADGARELFDRSGETRTRWRGQPSNGSWWRTEPNVGRLANGVPSRVDRLRSLGNSLVPQIPEIIGRAILKSQSDRRP